MGVPYRVAVGIVGSLCVLGSAAVASGIGGIGGFALGESFRADQASGGPAVEDGLTVYTVAPRVPGDYVQTLRVGVNREHRIARLTASAAPMDAVACRNAMNEMRRTTEERSPQLGYYAMQNSELFFEGTRSYTIECVQTGAGQVLRQEYWDEALEPGGDGANGR